MTSQASALTAHHLTTSEIEQAWISGGGPKALAPIMAAIAMAESSGNPSSIQQGVPYGSQGWGLWQITPGDSEPQVGSNQALLNPVTNARAAVAKYNSQGLQAWTTYTSGAYKRYMGGTSTTGSMQQSLAGGSGTPSTSTAANPQAMSTIEQLMANKMSSYEAAQPTAQMAALDAQTVGGYTGFAAFGLGAQSKEAVIGWNGVMGVGSFTLLTKGTLRKILGVGFAVVGGIVLAGGAALTLKVLQLEQAADIVSKVPGAKPVVNSAKKVTGSSASTGSPSTATTTTTAGAEAVPEAAVAAV